MHWMDQVEICVYSIGQIRGGVYWTDQVEICVLGRSSGGSINFFRLFIDQQNIVFCVTPRMWS